MGQKWQGSPALECRGDDPLLNSAPCRGLFGSCFSLELGDTWAESGKQECGFGGNVHIPILLYWWGLRVFMDHACAAGAASELL